MRTVITHFDGDPFILSAWLKLYEKNWRGECDKVIMGISYKKDLVPMEVVECEKKLLSRFPEITVVWKDWWITPEESNKELLSLVDEGNIGLIESDGLIFKKGFVASCFEILESGYNIVAPSYRLLPPEMEYKLGSIGYMRCFFFTTKNVLNTIDIDFNPRSVGNYDLDCFGWISLQLAELKLKTFYIADGLVRPDEVYWQQIKENGYCHIRQMSSSTLGMGGGEYLKWKTEGGSKEEIGDAGRFTYLKAVVFKEFFIENFLDPNLPIKFVSEYRNVLESAVQNYNLNREYIEYKKKFLKELL